jgi:hypothetical protein
MIKGLLDFMRERAICFAAGKKETGLKFDICHVKRAYRIEVRQLAQP